MLDVDGTARTQTDAKGNAGIRCWMLMGAALIGEDNTFYSTLDRIDSGEVPIRAMAEIL